ncbi:DUF6266 family protein [Flavobacterium sp. SM2513]|uniref:DUF6266 family protein n=1 Tax=Flavobacterium sp. SM2513 TaxID=3424766 RepID=UPI003D7F62DD
MATYKQGITGAFSGTIGAVVGVNFRGANVIRTKPKKRTKDSTPAQLVQQAKFAKVIDVLFPLKELLNTYFGTPEGTRSRYNLATSFHLREAIKIENDTAVVLYNKMVFALGTLLPVDNLQCKNAPDATLLLTWKDNSPQAITKTSDQLIAVVINPEAKSYYIFTSAATRADTTATLVLPPSFIGQDVHVYVFMASEDGKINSSSVYLGNILIV